MEAGVLHLLNIIGIVILLPLLVSLVLIIRKTNYSIKRNQAEYILICIILVNMGIFIFNLAYLYFNQI